MIMKKSNSDRRENKGPRGDRRRDVRGFRSCPFCSDKNNVLVIDYKNVDLLRKYVTERGKIVARRNSGVCAKHQRQLAKEIKRARYLALVPYVVYTYR